MLWSTSIGTRTPPLLILPGSYSNVADFPDSFFERIRGVEDRMIVRCDHRDSGRSPWYAAPDYTIHDMANDAMDVMREHPRFGVIGISMGGIVAQHMAVAYPERIDSLTLMMTTSNIKRMTWLPSMVREQIYSARGCASRALLTRWNDHSGYMSKQTRQKRMRRVLEHGFNYNAHHGDAMFAYNGTDLAQISCPTRIVHGTSDKLVDVDHAYEMQSNIPHAELRLLQGIGHDIHEDNLNQWLSAITRLAPKR